MPIRLKKDLGLARLREALDYDPATGAFVWTAAANSRFRGKPAGFIAKGYRIIRLDGVGYFAHRLAWLHVHGRWPMEFIDHINGVKSDNRIANLREATCQQNAFNSKARAASGLKGVYRRTANRDRWYAEIRLNGKTKTLGTFGSREEAAAVFAEAARLHRGEFVRLS